jgi:hypothetical protein
MKRVALGAEAIVSTDIGSKFYYKLENIHTTDPSDVSLFTYTGTPILTVQTCTGLWHEQRQLYTFTLQRFEESDKSKVVRNEVQRQRLLQTVSLATNPQLDVETTPTNNEPPIQPSIKKATEVKTVPETKLITLHSLTITEKPFFSQLLSL